MSENNLKNLICLITGGAKGIGFAISKLLAENGVKVYITDNSNENIEAALRLVKDLNYKDNIRFSYNDISRRTSVEKWINEIINETGEIDILINNAAFVKWDSILNMSVEEQKYTMQVSYDGMIYCINHVLPGMLKKKHGYIINIGSSVADISAPYAAAKAAIECYTNVLDKELEGTGITVKLIKPGVVGGTDFCNNYKQKIASPINKDELENVANEVLSYLLT